jgi:hypothetical protein
MLGKLLAMALGGAIGGTIGYFATNLIVYKMEEIAFGEDATAEKELQQLKEFEDRVRAENEGGEEIGSLPSFPENEVRVPKNYSIGKSSLDSLVSKYNSIEVKESDEPYLLTEDEYQNDNGEIRQEPLVYWAIDGQLTDISNNLIENPKKVVGSTTLTKFGFIQSDPDILYVRNNKRNIDYEISKVEKSYAVEVQGVEDEIDPPKPVKRKPKVRKINEDSDDE